MASDDKELYKMLGALVQSNEDIKDELKFIHASLNKKDGDVKDLDKRLQNVEKRQYTIVIVATAVWGVIVMMVRKYL